MKVIEPTTVTTVMLTSSSVPENDYPVWSSLVSYAKGNRVVVPAVHRVYESVLDGNLANVPALNSPAKWIDIGPTNRWAMFDEAVGSQTTATGQIVVTLSPAVLPDALAVLDMDAASVRVQVDHGASHLYDETRTVDGDASTLLFTNLPDDDGATITVTLSAASGGATVSVGTLLIGTVEDLGLTEAGPTIGINDYSKRETDDFGVTTVVERAWAKRMSTRSLIETAAVDGIQRRLAALRARPALWIGEDGYDSLTIYGFFKDFSIDFALDTVSYCTLTVEGLTTAGAIEGGNTGIAIIFRNAATQPSAPVFGTGLVPDGWTAAPQDLVGLEYRWWSQAEFTGTKQITDWSIPVKVAGVGWSDIADDDPAHPKPQDGATNGSPVGSEVAGVPAETVVGQIGALFAAGADQAHAEAVTAHAEAAQARDDLAAEVARAQADTASIRSDMTLMQGDISGVSASVSDEAIVRATADSALADRLTLVESEVVDPGSGVAALVARIETEETTRAGETSALASRATAIESAVNDPTTGLNAQRARIATEETTRADADIALANRATALESAVTSPTTGNVALQSRIATEETTRASETGALATRAGALESTVNNPTTGVAAVAGRIATEETTRATETGALATRVTSTEVRAGSLEARTSITEGSIVDLAGKLAARVVLQALAGSGRAELSLWADANGGAGVDIVGDTRFKGLIIHDTGTVMMVQGLTNGVGFGTSNQFVYWYGPSKAINLCDEASALEYRKMNGAAFISGALLVGTLTTRAGTSDLSSAAVAETARFGSNGRTITVTLSYTGSAFSNTQVTSNAAFNSAVADVGATSADGTYYTASGNDPGGWSVDLYRSVNGGAYVKVTTLSGGGAWSWNGSRPGPPGEPGNIVYFDDQGGSLTYTDPQNIAQDRQYKAVLASRNPRFPLTLQNISLVCTEE